MEWSGSYNLDNDEQQVVHDQVADHNKFWNAHLVYLQSVEDEGLNPGLTAWPIGEE